MPGRRGRRPGAKAPKKIPSVSSPRRPWSDDWSPTEVREAECALCRNMLLEPARLPCGHRFCLGCVRTAVEMSTGCCPLCRVRCAGWLRRATLQNRLVDDRLWEHIRRTFPKQVAARMNADADAESESADLEDDRHSPVYRKLSAPGEIRNEYETELQKAREERNLLENKYSEENEKLIRELQQQEKLELQSRNLKIQEDEKFARELAVSLNKSTRGRNATEAVAKTFYNHLGKSTDGSKNKTLDSFVKKTDKPNIGNKKSPPLTAGSPELVSTANRCGRFLKNFLNVKLWGFNSNATNAQAAGSSRVEPKIWELEKNCPGSDHELSVSSGVVTHRNKISSHPSIKPSTIATLDEGAAVRKIDSDIESEDSISQELRYFKPVQPNPIIRFNGKLVKSVAIRKHALDYDISNNAVPDRLSIVNALENLRKTEISNLGFRSAFVCLLAVPKSCIKEHPIDYDTIDKTPTKKSATAKNRNGNADHKLNGNSKTTPKRKRNNSKRTPQKNGAIKRRCKKVSQSYTKDNKDLNLRSRVSANLKRSISFDDVALINGKNANDTNDRVLRSNGHSEKCNGSSKKPSPSKNGTKTNGFNAQNGNHKMNNGAEYLDDLEQSTIDEQRRIEEMIAQERKDFALAKKLQRQFGGFVNTGYTLRTATKRQASLTELLPPSKSMRI